MQSTSATTLFHLAGKAAAQVTPAELQRRIEGVLDGPSVARALTKSVSGNGSTAFDQKFTWLCEWLRTEATAAELRMFCVFTTGMESPGTGIKVTPRAADTVTVPAAANGDGGSRTQQTPMIQVRAHTCFNHLELNRDFSAFNGHTDETKPGFLALLKSNLPDTSFTMA